MRKKLRNKNDDCGTEILHRGAALRFEAVPHFVYEMLLSHESKKLANNRECLHALHAGVAGLYCQHALQGGTIYIGSLSDPR